MSKKKLFDEDSEEDEVRFKTENEYAKRYDNWREKEELHKLEQKYGSKALSSDASLSSDSEDDSDEPPEVSEEMETQFLKTLALLKTKDPRIYDPNFKCFDDEKEKIEEQKPKEKTLTFEDSDEDDESDDGNIFKVEKKAEIAIKKPEKKASEGTKKEGKLKEFLTGAAEHIDDEVEQDLAPLKALWSDPKLNEGEAFLRDYILNKKYLEEGEAGEAEGRLRDDEELEEDEKRVEEQGKFERAYNFRFEEPDQEYLKRYPRTMNYIRPKDDQRARKRAEVRARKEEEKRRKMEEIGRLKALKLKEIQDKIAKIKEVTGNQDLAFKEEDIEGDFDPAEHDRRMQALFDEEFYGGADKEKPVFPDLDEELEIENWDKFEEERLGRGDADEGGEVHCEDEDFNMDADYDPKQARVNLLQEIQSTLGKKRRNRKKKSKLAQLLASEKPKFVPTVAENTYDEYMEEYYKMDCEDVIGGDLPTRFKYRQVVPNDFGLSIEEILLADDKELTQWVPLKRIVKHRPEDAERNDVRNYRQKAADERLKKKILPSLFKDLPPEPEVVVPVEAAKKKKKKTKKKNKETNETKNTEDDVNDTIDTKQNGNTEDAFEVKIKKKKKKNKEYGQQETDQGNNKDTGEKKKHNKQEETKGSSLIKESTKKTKPHEEGSQQAKDDSSPNKEISKKKKKKRKDAEKDSSAAQSDVEANVNHAKQKHTVESYEGNAKADREVTEINTEISKKKKKQNREGFVVENVQKVEPSQAGNEGIRKKNKPLADGEKLNLKRKLDQQKQVPNKKKKKEFNKFKQKQIVSGKPGKDSRPMNPLTNLSDERLKAYGLNPKKYKNFLKFKKF